MQQDHLYVAFLDVLAYRQYLEMDIKNGTLDFQKKLTGALRVLDSINTSVFQVRAISDTVIITCENHVNFTKLLSYLRKIFISFMKQGLFIRGGVAYAKHFQSNYLTYSHAVSLAHKLESTLAVYPRIVIDDNILEMYRSAQDDMPEIFASDLFCEENGIVFLNILTSKNWRSVHASAKVIYGNNREVLRTNEHAFDKHVRFERYLLSSQHAKVHKSFIAKVRCVGK